MRILDGVICAFTLCSDRTCQNNVSTLAAFTNRVQAYKDSRDGTTLRNQHFAGYDILQPAFDYSRSAFAVFMERHGITTSVLRRLMDMYGYPIQMHSSDLRETGPIEQGYCLYDLGINVSLKWDLPESETADAYR